MSHPMAIFCYFFFPPESAALDDFERLLVIALSASPIMLHGSGSFEHFGPSKTVRTVRILRRGWCPAVSENVVKLLQDLRNNMAEVIVGRDGLQARELGQTHFDGHIQNSTQLDARPRAGGISCRNPCLYWSEALTPPGDSDSCNFVAPTVRIIDEGRAGLQECRTKGGRMIGQS